jgi:hypothetical protein
MSPTPIRASTQEFLEISDIVDDILVLTSGGCALVLETGAVNFALLAKEEQEAIIYAFAAFLNSLSFSIQIVIFSKKMRINDYLSYISEAANNQKSVRLQEKLSSYRRFIESLVKNNQVLEKRFFIVIPFSPLELGIKGSGGSFSKSKKLPYKLSYVVERAKTTLYPKRDHVLRQISRLGLKAVQLNNAQLLSFFYELYNNESESGQKATEGITSPLVTGKQ